MNQQAQSPATPDEIPTWRPPPPAQRAASGVVRAVVRRYPFACAEVVFSSCLDARRDP